VALLESHRADEHGDKKIAEMDWGHAACAVVTVANEIHSEGMKRCVKESVAVTCLWSLARKFAEESDRGGGNGG
jgi:hypothetical protein